MKVHSHGTLRDGTVFASSVDRGTPAEFPLNGVIPCWTEGGAFAANGASCHGTKADGPGTEAKTLTSIPTNFLAPTYTKSAARITYGKGDVMPAFDGTLSEAEIWDTANFLRSLQRPGME